MPDANGWFIGPFLSFSAAGVAKRKWERHFASLGLKIEAYFIARQHAV
jgi:hypothetical protein